MSGGDDPHRVPWPDTGHEAGLFELEGGVAAGQEPGTARLKKSATAFRTISEVADELHVPQHVLRFWETRFPQVKPLKRGGGRRYYRPDDVGLLRRIADLLYIQGYTIKGVQRLLRDGDGTLEGDLPPPEIADQDGDQQPLVGQDDPASLPEREPVRPAPHQPGPLSATGRTLREAPSPVAISSHSQSLEIGRLRTALGMVLAELEILRRQLPP